MRDAVRGLSVLGQQYAQQVADLGHADHARQADQEPLGATDWVLLQPIGRSLQQWLHREHRQQQLLQQLATCESGSWGPQPKPIYGGRGAYHGRFQFTPRTYVTYARRRDGTVLKRYAPTDTPESLADNIRAALA